MGKNNRGFAWALAFIAVLSGCDQKASFQPTQQSGSSPPLPPVRNFLLPPMQVPAGIGWSRGQAPKVAPGLKIEKIASGLLHPRQLYVLPNGDVLVAESGGPGTEAVTTPKQLIASKVQSRSGKESKGGNRITLLRRKENASSEWDKHVYAEHLNSPFGMQLIGETLYIGNTDAIVTLPYHSGDTRTAAEAVEFTDLPGTVNHHWTKPLLASADGTKLYAGVGSNSNVTENGLEVEYRRAMVLEVDVATRGSRIYASGIRNPTGLQWEPQTGRLWAISNERDEIGADLVPDYLTSVQDGGFYGWPYSFYGQHVDRRVEPQRPDLVAKAIIPDYAIGSHVAPLGLWFSQRKSLAHQYENGAFISEHGSWDRSPLSGYEIVFVAFQQGKPVGKPETVVSGFYSADEKTLFGAPVGITQDQDGALLIADDVGSAIWRVSADSN